VATPSSTANRGPGPCLAIRWVGHSL
jgi:hypothetical protein